MYVIVGGLIGIFGSIIHDLWKERNEKKELKSRIKEDFEIIKDKLASDLQTGNVRAQAFFMDVYLALKQDLIRELNVKTSQSVLQTHIKIEELRFPFPEEELKKKYLETINVIDGTLKLL
jgi:hypothetical protein